MWNKLVLSSVTVAAIGIGLSSGIPNAQAHHFSGCHGSGHGLFFSPPGYPDDGFYGDDHYNYRYYNDGYYDNGYYGGYRKVRRHAGYRCHIGTVRYHHRMHDARICNGRVTRVY